MIMPDLFIFAWQHVISSHVVSPTAGSYPSMCMKFGSHGTHHPDCARSSLRHGLWTHSLIGPLVEVPVPSPRWTRSSHAVAPANISVESISEVVLQPVISW